MFFVVDVERRVMEAWRLQGDGSWRDVSGDRSIHTTDRRFKDLTQLEQFRQSDLLLNINGRNVTVNASGTRHPAANWLARFWVKREERPPIPSKQEMIQVVRAGDDQYSNTLVINLDGHFQLREWTDGYIPVGDLDIAVRMETFGASNNYVGEDAADAKGFTDRLYCDYLALWIEHLRSGRINIYSDLGDVGRSDAQLLEELQRAMDQVGLK